LTKPGERLTFINVKREASVAVGVVLVTLLAAPLGFLPARTLPEAPGGQTSQQVQPPKYDYMSGFRQSSTRPLGLKENPALKKMLDEGSVKWAIRAGFRHVLD
jgi:hypothetical protein